jgi:hypothetical protein
MASWKALAKQARPLFALAATACATNVGASYPLCDERGSPACGNIGQVGRPNPARPQSSSLQPIMADVAPRGGIPILAIATTTVGIGLAATTIAVIAGNWPYENGDDDDVEPITPAPIVVVAPTPPPPQPLTPVHEEEEDEDIVVVDTKPDECANRPLQDDQCRPACGNVIKHGKGGSWCRRAQ